jgi:hypothetical protein
VNWFGSFEFGDMEGDEPSIVLDEVDTDALRLFRRIRSRGHVYKINPNEPLATLQIASEPVEQSQGAALLRFRLPDDLLLDIRKLIGQRVKKSGRV